MIYLLLYFLVISLSAVVLTVSDKHFSKTHGQRVPEKRLLILGILGGALAEYICMLVIRHKTKHKKFMIGLPCIIILQTLLGSWLWQQWLTL